MFNLYIGDIDSDLSQVAMSADAGAVLIDQHNLSQFLSSPQGTGFTTIGDCGGAAQIFSICRQATEIFFCDPIKWSDTKKGYSEHQERITSILNYWRKLKPVHGFTRPENFPWVDDALKVKGRVSESQQGWAFGCSLTYGIGVAPHEAWPALAFNKLNLPYTNAGYPGGSITWSSDQLCRSQIQTGDVVFWGLPNNLRAAMIDQGKLKHLGTWAFKEDPLMINRIPLDFLNSDTLIYQNITAIHRAVNFCRAIGAKLVIQCLYYDPKLIEINLDDIKEYRQLICCPGQIVDVGNDASTHPGPNQHIIYADSFVSTYQELYGTDVK